MGRDYIGGEPVDWENYALMNPKGKVIPRSWKVDEMARLKKQGFSDEQEVRQIANESLERVAD